MTNDRLKQLQDLFTQALEIPESERDVWVVGQCGDDQELLAHVSCTLKCNDAMTVGRQIFRSTPNWSGSSGTRRRRADRSERFESYAAWIAIKSEVANPFLSRRLCHWDVYARFGEHSQSSAFRTRTSDLLSSVNNIFVLLTNGFSSRIGRESTSGASPGRRTRAASVFFNYWRNSSPIPSTKNSTLPHLGQQ